MNKGTRIALITIVVLFIIGLFVYPRIKQAFFAKEFDDSMKKSTANAAPGGGGSSRELPIEAIIVKSSTIVEKETRTGTLLPAEEVDLSFEASGKITDIFFKEGTYIRKGDLLAKINDKRLQAQLQKLENQLKLSESREFRQKALLAKDAVSQESYDQVTTEVENFKADIAYVKAQIYETELRAPFDGIIGLRQVSEGAYATPSTKIAKLTKVSPLKLEFSVPERYKQLLNLGLEVTFNISEDKTKEYKAKIYAIDSKIDEATRTFQVRAEYPNSNMEIPPGSYASIKMEVMRVKEGIAIPAQALIPEMGKQRVFLYRNGKAEPIEVNLGVRTASEVQITDGLATGDTVITTGILQMRKGLPVKIEKIVSGKDDE